MTESNKARGGRAAAAPARDISPERRRFVQIWTKAWGLIGAVIIVFIAYGLPEQLRAGDGGALLRSAGLGLVCMNLILQASKQDWPVVYALPMTVIGISIWLVGWLA